MNNMLLIRGTNDERTRFIRSLVQHEKLIAFIKKNGKNHEGIKTYRDIINASYAMLDESLYDNLNVLENIKLYKSLVKPLFVNEDILLETFNLKQYAKVYYGKLEKNIQYRVRLAISLLHGHQIAIWEEPFLYNLDVFQGVQSLLKEKDMILIFSGEEIPLHKDKYSAIDVEEC